MARATGTCKWFNSTKGFGFIETSTGEDVFVHQTSIKADGFRSLAEGEALEFTIQADPDGRKKAIDVSGPGGAPVKGAPRQEYGGGGGGYDQGGYGGGSYGGGGGGRGGGGGGYGGGGGNYGGGGYGGGGDSYGGGGYGGGGRGGGGGGYGRY